MRIYLAGFDVFRPDAVAHGERLKALCAELGMQGWYPLDNEIARDLRSAEAARAICEANLDLIRRCDAVAANLNPFRGHEPDSGTVFEVGYAVALGKPVWAYAEAAGDIVSRVTGQRAEAGMVYTDGQGYTVENFGLGLNLMIACSVRLVPGDAAACLRALAAAHGLTAP
ncbi:nucleoside 2-deoxyribosyltransferase [Verticiella sediminum]|uniref:Nucleoside 2-deoxyribosyltransferase n=1 Tax=Verticiella sediminum TaxID=1247510 RepID=A0A556AS91_9BURK|nr:nucleoside 2-deoxyribosyltransferase [Verticiella sediminum]TSH95812.1 nucleoside 2-deoxyribosyltransferase [Verticiella sediminum]